MEGESAQVILVAIYFLPLIEGTQFHGIFEGSEVFAHAVGLELVVVARKVP